MMTPTLPHAPAAVPHRPLRGKNIALLTAADAGPAAAALQQAASALGAQVVQVRLDSLPPFGAPHFTETLALLGRLYDGVLADGVPGEVLQEVARVVDRPIVDQGPATAQALAGPEGDASEMLQSLLAQALA